MGLFVALGGASYAAVAVPDNSVGTRQLTFPLGVGSRQYSDTVTSVSVCLDLKNCEHSFPPTKLRAIRISLKRASRVLIVGQVQAIESAPAKHGSTTLDFGALFDFRAFFDQYQVSTRPTTITYSEVLKTRAGRVPIGLFMAAFSQSGPARTVRLDNPQLTVIVLPGLH
jgi:hypothetical protein